MNTMQLAWQNAQAAKDWHGVGTKREYFAGALRLAHKGHSVRKAIFTKVAIAGLATFTAAVGYGALLALTWG